MSNKTSVTLSELARELNINKSKLQFFYSLDLIKSTEQIGGINIFNRVNTLQTLKKIDKLKTKGRTLEQIRVEQMRNKLK